MNSDQMRELAKQYRAKAEAVSNIRAKATLTETAEIWEKLAERHDTLGSLSLVWPDGQTKDKSS
jgi:hypothetical protein